MRYLFWIVLFTLICYTEPCVDNCMAYQVSGTWSYYSAYSLFWLPQGENECKQCYFNINAYSSGGNYVFYLGLYGSNYSYFSSAVYGRLNAESGFTTCEPG